MLWSCCMVINTTIFSYTLTKLLFCSKKWVMRVKETKTELMSERKSHGKIRESTRYKHAHRNIIQRIPTVSPGVFSQKLGVPFCFTLYLPDWEINGWNDRRFVREQKSMFSVVTNTFTASCCYHTNTKNSYLSVHTHTHTSWISILLLVDVCV